MIKLTKGLHPSKHTLGYYYILENGIYKSYCGSILLSEHKYLSDCLELFKNRQ